MNLFLKSWGKAALFSIFFLFSLYIYYILSAIRFLSYGNDLIGNIASFIYIKSSLLNYHIFPQWNPYFGQGTPIAGDPLNSIYNPLVFITFIILPYASAVSVVYLFCIFFSCLSMYLLSRYFKIENLISLLLALTYSASGYLSGQIVAGHIEKMLAYPLIPLFFLLLFRAYKKPTMLHSGLIAFTITLLIFTASIYEAFYAGIIIATSILYLFVAVIVKRDKEKIKKIIVLILAVFLTPLFSALKLLPMLQANSSLIRRYNPFLGSQNVISILYNFFLPYNNLFSVFHLQQYLSSPYQWWESFAFIGPFTLVGLLISVCFSKKIVNKEYLLMGFILLALLLFSMLGNPFNPFYWLFTILTLLKEFRIPSRIFIYIIPLLLILSAAGFNYIYQANRFLIKVIILICLCINLYLVTFMFKNYIRYHHLPYMNMNSSQALNYLNNLDGSRYFIGQSVLFQNQLSLYTAFKNNQVIFDPNYGWGINNNFASNYGEIDFTRTGNYYGIYPKYFIYPNGVLPPLNFKTYPLKKIGGFTIYENDQYTPYAYITNKADYVYTTKTRDVRIKSVLIIPNKIIVKAYSPNNKLNLVIAQNNYPGWNVERDNNAIEMQQNGVLTVPMENGLHTYTFTFNSALLGIGLFISIISICLWGIYCYLRRYRQ